MDRYGILHLSALLSALFDSVVLCSYDYQRVSLRTPTHASTHVQMQAESTVLWLRYVNFILTFTVCVKLIH